MVLKSKSMGCTQSLAGQLSPILALKLLLFKCKGYISFDQASVRFYEDITSNIINTVREETMNNELKNLLSDLLMSFSLF